MKDLLRCLIGRTDVWLCNGVGDDGRVVVWQRVGSLRENVRRLCHGLS